MAGTTMDFFESQDRARKKTFVLILFYMIAVLFIIIGIYSLIFTFKAYIIATSNKQIPPMEIWQPDMLMWVALGVSSIIFFGSAFKILSLSKGGLSVVKRLGGIPVDPSSHDTDKRRLLNVVEEMAIASGIPVPQVYLLPDETGINAFAAGITPSDAVITVTQGCMKELTRDELQGVIAHEFSHILNGDMNLNIRLMGIIAGILIVGLTGKTIVRGSGKVALQLLKLGKAVFMSIPLFFFVTIPGLIIMAIGSIGVFFAKVIKSGVSCQREFLADAAAVQFTRNPSGLLGALKKIASHRTGSRIMNVHAEEASHLFFGNGLKHSFLSLWETHPPIEERIRRIESGITENFKPVSKEQVEVQESLIPHISSFSFPVVSSSDQQAEISLPPEELTYHVGNPQTDHLIFAAQVLSDLPPVLAEAVRETFGSRSIIYCLLLDKGKDLRKVQMELLNNENDPMVLKEIELFMPIIDALDAKFRLPIVELAIPSLKIISPTQYKVFRGTVKKLMEADEKISLFEYALQRMLIHHLDPIFHKTPPPQVKFRAIYQIEWECFLLLSFLAWRSNAGTQTAEESFRRGITELGIAEKPAIMAEDKNYLRDLDYALDRLAMATFQLKTNILRACLACISADSMVTVDEVELLRVIADSLDCPIPPVLSKLPSSIIPTMSVMPGEITT